jgi:hypothetical protein
MVSSDLDGSSDIFDRSERVYAPSDGLDSDDSDGDAWDARLDGDAT